MMTVREVEKRTGVSIRTLQYYDKIGLLKATAHTESGYRLYDDDSLERLQQILLFRELEFSLKDIARILNAPGFDGERALEQQIALLELKKARIEKLITLARGIRQVGGKYMDFSAFDTEKLDSYARQAKESWGKTDAYREFEEKSRNRTREAGQALGRGLMEIFARMGQIKDLSPAGAEAQALVRELQGYITQNYYHCTNQILLGLGRMYAAGDDFTENIDAVGGTGTAAFANDAITEYCK